MIRVLGIGISRTGTTTMQTALQTLQFGPSYHSSILTLNGHEKHWLTLRDDPEADLSVLDPYASTAGDVPCYSLWKTLIRRFPEAKVILTIRDPNDWYESWLHAIHPIPPPNPILRKEFVLPFYNHQYGPDHREHMIQTFNNYNDEVRDTIPADRLLVFDVREGWDPLSRFLLGRNMGAWFPKFPRVNSLERIT